MASEAVAFYRGVGAWQTNAAATRGVRAGSACQRLRPRMGGDGSSELFRGRAPV